MVVDCIGPAPAPAQGAQINGLFVGEQEGMSYGETIYWIQSCIRPTYGVFFVIDEIGKTICITLGDFQSYLLMVADEDRREGQRFILMPDYCVTQGIEPWDKV